ncbi:uncharacterized protein ColSpa_09162 [Colletotrichum spaethianum]|uniref:Uncharacterized protein n=1 Tax=Colletotrichum spaethianum TaxID=700344 RepID=A0AA37PB26_9PEZI|nr:uncharacterized protein ColSpa_09162 [Colletotrichum spaethianum]GKT48981.1 hypothetical protein ColSpa_09162 [Colletotrichum spaethianum]
MTETGASGAALAGSSITLVPFAASFLYADIASAFSAEAFTADASWCSEQPSQDADLPCRPRISVNRWAVNVVISGLAAVAVSLIFIIGLWYKTPSRITVDTTSISGVARVVGHPEVERAFTTIPVDMTNAQLAAYLKDKRFALGTFQAESGEKYGLVPVEEAEDRPRSFFQRTEIWAVQKKASFKTSSWTQTRFKVDVLFGVFHLALLGLGIAALVNVDNPRRIFSYDSRPATIAVRVSMCFIGILVSRYWGMVFADAQNFAPYARMHAKPSKAEGTIIKRGYNLPLLAIVPLARMGYFIPMVVAITALLAEFFVITVSGLPWRPGQLRGEYIFCGVGCVMIALLMLTAQGLMFYWRSTLPTLPRRPDSVASVMTYVAGTTMSRDFNAVSALDEKTADKTIAEMGKRYAYGMKVEEDGRQRWVVDEVGMGYEGNRTRTMEHTA